MRAAKNESSSADAAVGAGRESTVARDRRARGPEVATTVSPEKNMPLHGGAPLANDRTPLLAIGILSVDSVRYAPRRDEQRQTWVGDAHAIGDDTVYCRFTLRCGTWAMSPEYDNEALRSYTPSASFLSENATYGDMICTPVPENAGRLKGPSLGVLAWFDHVLAVRPHARYIAMADDDAYLHVPELVAILQGIPIHTYTYIGAIMGWSFHDANYQFRNFGWTGCGNCTGPFPFAVGAFMAVSAPLAGAVAAGTRAAQPAAANRSELERVYGLSPGHRIFYQDAFIGGAIARLAEVGDELINVYDLETLYLDTDGFNVARSLVIWHNRYKLACRTLCLGEYYHSHFCPADFTWGPGHKPGVDRRRYRIWGVHGYRRPRASPTTTLSGRAALVNGTCDTTIDLRDLRTAQALGLDACLRCHGVARSAAAQAKQAAAQAKHNRSSTARAAAAAAQQHLQQQHSGRRLLPRTNADRIEFEKRISWPR